MLLCCFFFYKGRFHIFENFFSENFQWNLNFYNWKYIWSQLRVRMYFKVMDKVFPSAHREQLTILVSQILLKTCCKMYWRLFFHRLLEYFFGCYKATPITFGCLAGWLMVVCFALRYRFKNRIWIQKDTRNAI